MFAFSLYPMHNTCPCQMFMFLLLFWVCNVIGMHDLLTEIGQSDSTNTLSIRLWDIFMRLLESCNPKRTESYSISMRHAHESYVTSLV